MSLAKFAGHQVCNLIFYGSIALGIAGAPKTIKGIVKDINDLRRYEQLADSTHMDQNIAKLKAQLTCDQYDTLISSISKTDRVERPLNVLRASEVLGNARSLAADSAQKLVFRTIESFKKIKI
jgi:hypothetical protein